MTYLAEVGDGGPSETEDTVDGVAGEGAGESGYGREVLALHSETTDGDWKEVNQYSARYYNG